jgi:serine/threonine protein kinase
MDSSSLNTIVIIILICIVVLSIIITALLIRFCRKNKTNYNEIEEYEYYNSNDDHIQLLNKSFSSYGGREAESTFIDNHYGNRIENTLISKEKMKRERKYAQQAEEALVYLQFFMRSNSMQPKAVKQLAPAIGTRPTRNWFLITEQSAKLKIIYTESIDKESMSLGKKKFLTDVSASMELSLGQMQQLVSEILVSIEHKNILKFTQVDYNFEKSTLLCLLDFSNEGSLRDFICNTKCTDDYLTKSRTQIAEPLSNYLIKQYGKQVLDALIYLKNIKLFPIDNLHAGIKNIINIKLKIIFK